MSADTGFGEAKVTAQLRSLGVEAGGVLVVHTAFSKLAPLDGGPQGLIRALLAAVGPEGTLVMPSMSDDDDHPFDRWTTPCLGMGVVAETFWRLSGVLRSDSPHAFAAIGPRAEEITAAHPMDVPHGLDSPIGRVYELGGQVLLLGVGHDANTTIHLAENLAEVRYGRRKHLVTVNGGQLTRVDYIEIDHCCEKFNLLDGWLDQAGEQRRGIVGRGPARLASSRAIVHTALVHLAEDETTFLHPPGLCTECDEARATLSLAAESSDASQASPQH
ncbi:MAG TPA: AAC(3) family N-acetyltransferase [Gemmatimonadales bacterium]|nr:AAC(3) family N-acetyltransferase [Gemmatimonadales bacterium]